MAFESWSNGEAPFHIENVQMGAAHTTKKSVAIPEWAKTVDLQARSGDVRIYATSGGTNYWTLAAGQPESFDGQDFRNTTIYCSGNGTTVYLEVRVIGAT